MAGTLTTPSPPLNGVGGDRYAQAIARPEHVARLSKHLEWVGEIVHGDGSEDGIELGATEGEGGSAIPVQNCS